MVRKLNILALTLLVLILVLAVTITKIQLGSFSLLFNLQELNGLLWLNYTLPRLIMATLAGIGLGVATVILQQLTRNQLASDSTLAVSSGAQLFITVASIFLPTYFIYGSSLVAFIGAFFALVVVLALSSVKRANNTIVVLSGMVVCLYCSALSSILILIYPEETRSVTTWAAGSLIQDSWLDTIYLALSLLVTFILVGLFTKSFSLLSLDDESAKRIGVPVRYIRLVGLVLAAFIVASIVSRVGMLGFIGLISTALVRSLGARSFKQLLAYTPLVSALILLTTDLVLQLVDIFFKMQIPTGAVTSLIGTPVLLFLMLIDKSRSVVNVSADRNTHWQAPSNTKLYYLVFTSVIVLAGCVFWQANLEVIDLRAPRIMLVVGASMILAISGFVLQRISNNPLASPELMGITSGVNLGIMATIIALTSVSAISMYIGGVVGALVTLIVIQLLTFRSNLQPEKILLIGISVAALYDSAQRIFIATNDYRAYSLLNITSGSSYYATYYSGSIALLVALLLVIVMLRVTKIFDLFALNVTVASELGLDIFKTRLFLILLISLVVTIATLSIGSVSFVGLLAPHVAFSLGYKRPKKQLLASVIIAILLALISDFIARNIIFPYEIPVGLVTTLIGGLYFIYIARKL
ncbi:Fe3+-hydroxamate ABC transporter permease FhuB [Psittacicella hinzii]|uniref:Fe3+-hydroxamate ABC transporter permease FhuB n=1 Tax=Psittacicella hinzii TaxID=2028575 RepID=A0A3A1Y0G9_9GAMM|nr:Fe(3+)-hydroxamate ABC transporter permease FhuB [Psittacicella hinzii]RIY31085.1 Fe3+-hydroxamate ABC transporter permease FhuB [Psittacicella hinzii]